jgi:flagellar biosynthesis chaperone FliJ
MQAIAKLPKKAAPTVAEAQLIFLNEIEKSTDQSVKQLKAVVTALEAVIAQLQTPKEWTFDIDRNFQTGRIQGVTAKQVKET